MLGHEWTPGPLRRLDRRAARARVTELSQRYGLDVDPDAMVGELPVGVQQRVEIIKALAHDVDVLILDEPTAVLTPQEIDELIRIMRELRDGGQVDRVHHAQAARGQGGRRPDHRDPARQGGRRRPTPATSETELASMMVGRDVQLVVDKDAGAARRGQPAHHRPARRRRPRPGHCGRSEP